MDCLHGMVESPAQILSVTLVMIFRLSRPRSMMLIFRLSRPWSSDKFSKSASMMECARDHMGICKVISKVITFKHTTLRDIT